MWYPDVTVIIFALISLIIFFGFGMLQNHPFKRKNDIEKNFQLFNFITVNLLQKKVPKNYCCDSENLSQFQSSQFNGLPICSFGLEKKTLHDYTYWFSPSIFLVYCYNFIQITHHYAKFKGNQIRAIKLSVCTWFLCTWSIILAKPEYLSMTPSKLMGIICY